MNTEQQIEQVELSIESAKKAVDMRDSLIALTKNKHFKKVISEGYFEKEASNLVLSRGEPALQTEEDQADLLSSIDAIGNFRQYLIKTMQFGNTAEKSLKEHETTKEELLQEQLDE